MFENIAQRLSCANMAKYLKFNFYFFQLFKFYPSSVLNQIYHCLDSVLVKNILDFYFLPHSDFTAFEKLKKKKVIF